MEVQLGVGAVLDIATTREIDSIVRGALNDSIRRPGDVVTGRRAGTSVNLVNANGVQAPVDLGGPAQGKLWDVRSLTVALDTGSGPFASLPANSNIVFICAAMRPQPGQYEAAALDAGANATGVYTVGRWTIPVYSPNHLWAWVNLGGVVANGVLQLGLTAAEVSMTDEFLSSL